MAFDIASWTGATAVKDSIAKIIENFRALRDDAIATPAQHYHSITVNMASTANISSLSGLLTVDGVVTTAGMFILVKDQTTASQNGVYTVAAGAWTRTNFLYHVIKVSGGLVNSNLLYFLTTTIPITIGSTALSFSVATAGLVLPLNFINPVDGSETVRYLARAAGTIKEIAVVLSATLVGTTIFTVYKNGSSVGTITLVNVVSNISSLNISVAVGDVIYVKLDTANNIILANAELTIS